LYIQFKKINRNIFLNIFFRKVRSDCIFSQLNYKNKFKISINVKIKIKQRNYNLIFLVNPNDFLQNMDFLDNQQDDYAEKIAAAE
jgi:hypothetical protein